MAEATIRVEGLRETVKAIHQFGGDVSAGMDAALLRGATIVQEEASSLLVGSSAHSVRSLEVSAAGYKPQVMKTGRAIVQQTKRKSRRPGRRRPKYGKYQFEKALNPGLERKQGQVINEVRELLERAAARF